MGRADHAQNSLFCSFGVQESLPVLLHVFNTGQLLFVPTQDTTIMHLVRELISLHWHCALTYTPQSNSQIKDSSRQMLADADFELLGSYRLVQKPADSLGTRVIKDQARFCADSIKPHIIPLELALQIGSLNTRRVSVVPMVLFLCGLQPNSWTLELTGQRGSVFRHSWKGELRPYSLYFMRETFLSTM
jgi:hypothetical protein